MEPLAALWMQFAVQQADLQRSSTLIDMAAHASCPAGRHCHQRSSPAHRMGYAPATLIAAAMGLVCKGPRLTMVSRHHRLTPCRSTCLASDIGSHFDHRR